jgi:VIT1/CCC1 family predicted Fe2+/Mn2+ transporter
LLPYLFGARTLLLSVVFGGIALFAAGALVSRFTNRTVLYSGTRQLVLGGLATGVTYLIGQAVGGGV